MTLDLTWPLTLVIVGLVITGTSFLGAIVAMAIAALAGINGKGMATTVGIGGFFIAFAGFAIGAFTFMGGLLWTIGSIFILFLQLAGANFI